MSSDSSPTPPSMEGRPPAESRIAPATWPELIAYRLSPEAPTIVPASARRSWMDETSGGWAYRCLPMTLANQNGWLLLSPVTFEVVWNGSPRTDGLAFRFPHGPPSPIVNSLFGHGIVTWDVPYLFRTPPGYNLEIRGPANFVKRGAHALEGLVETDWAVATFTMNWKITNAFRKVRFDKDEPFCRILPQARGEAEAFQPEIRSIEAAVELDESYRRWATSRRSFSDRRASPSVGSEPRWQKHYTRGEAPGGEAAPEHQKKLRILPFADAAERRSADSSATQQSKPGARGRQAPGLMGQASFRQRVLLWARFFLGAVRRR